MQTTASLVLLLVAAANCVAGGTAPRAVSVVNGRIINGEPAAVGEFPAQLSLQRNGRHSCGASILNENWALTAAHCVDGLDSDIVLEVLAGTITLDDGGTRHNVESFTIHPQYDESDSWVNDIALLRYDGFLPNNLQKVDIEVWSQDLCASLFWDAFESPVYPSHICAAGVDERDSSCNGDSGGPLLHEGVVVGLVSWSYLCATPPFPTVYTRVSSYVDWINQQISV
ncbi:trypsin delta-like [Schistocerca piceifrons]|uniref:trypsin delta-like n=1 Tax=Schistocerca piceifrons TaxID=274613 RepID=UPI001F5EDD67|nr:trypsin delta-like [Schistocerca piceifrons]